MKSNNAYPLEERTAVFGERIIRLCRAVPKDIVTTPIISQLIKSGTSLGANYMEANGGSSPKDFTNKIHICLKEARETKFWLRQLACACPDRKSECQMLWKETHELVLIFAKIAQSSKKK